MPIERIETKNTIEIVEIEIRINRTKKFGINETKSGKENENVDLRGITTNIVGVATVLQR